MNRRNEMGCGAFLLLMLPVMLVVFLLLKRLGDQTDRILAIEVRLDAIEWHIKRYDEDFEWRVKNLEKGTLKP